MKAKKPIRHAKKAPTRRFQTPWTPKKIKAFRAHWELSQSNLARLLNVPQQRVNEWELGKHAMRRAYSNMMEKIEYELNFFLTRTKGDKRLMLFKLAAREGLTVETQWKCDQDGLRRNETASFPQESPK